MRARAGGFTLLEIAVAMAILGTGVVTLQQIYQGSLRLQDRASRESRAVLHARTAMDSLLWQRPPPLKDECRDDAPTREGFLTHRCIHPATPEQGGVGKAGDLGFEASAEAQTLQFVEVTVSWQDGAGLKTYTLQSLRLAREDDEE